MAVVSVCPTCHHENEADARRCVSCGADLPAEPAAAGEARKVVTVLFSDVTGSTVLGDELDPESLRRLMGRYFQEMKEVLQRHGGTTEKFIGDAVMAVFGVPRLHEDDALRAVRAAIEMRQSLHRLNDEFEQTWGVRIMVRTGVNTGEVIAGDPTRGESFVVGDAVNVAARLEQTAEPGQILIGETTLRLVRDAVTVEALEPLSLKGKPAPVPAWQLLDVTPAAPGWARHLDAPLVGRDQELASIRAAFAEAESSRSCQLVTVMAPAGVGKSRLAAEFLATLQGDTTVLSGRCLPYGEGITFWPIVDVIKDVIGIGQLEPADEPTSKLRDLLGSAEDAEIITERLEGLLGLSRAAPGIQETFWAVRKLFEQLAMRGTLVVVFEDIHWGEPTFLDLVEYLADWIHGLPVLLLCLARPELLEIRGAWMTGKPNHTLIPLKSLSEGQTEGLIHELLGGAELFPEISVRIAEVTEGNPLFVEETIRMLVDDGLLHRSNGQWSVSTALTDLTIPPTIHALLTARLDRLDAEERAVIERASVVGRVFWWGAVSELLPPGQRAAVGGALQSLTRKELVSPDRSDLREED
ncbi:MAG TPA: adenylate/guanylate cyclase domain-containing protein, partial [Actinomycetota bacterium]|nr:adenylate/guanylate cyclase domain-containing protein [Actinomycetota bacterium]